jgi:hypothetical protein
VSKLSYARALNRALAPKWNATLRCLSSARTNDYCVPVASILT